MCIYSLYNTILSISRKSIVCRASSVKNYVGLSWKHALTHLYFNLDGFQRNWKTKCHKKTNCLSKNKYIRTPIAATYPVKRNIEKI